MVCVRRSGQEQRSALESWPEELCAPAKCNVAQEHTIARHEGRHSLVRSIQRSRGIVCQGCVRAAQRGDEGRRRFADANKVVVEDQDGLIRVGLLFARNLLGPDLCAQADHPAPPVAEVEVGGVAERGSQLAPQAHEVFSVRKRRLGVVVAVHERLNAVEALRVGMSWPEGASAHQRRPQQNACKGPSLKLQPSAMVRKCTHARSSHVQVQSGLHLSLILQLHMKICGKLHLELILLDARLVRDALAMVIGICTNCLLHCVAWRAA